MTDTFDAIIVGAGPAGCTAAARLARKGHKVLLLEKHSFPREKICGDYLTSGTLAIVERMGALDQVLGAGAEKLHYMLASSPDGNYMKTRVPDGPGLKDFGIVLPRKILDKVLWDHVRALDEVTALDNFKVKDLVRESGQIQGVSGFHEGKARTMRARHIIAADGARSVVARQLGLANRNDRHAGFAIRAYFDKVSGMEDAIEVHVSKQMLPGYGWIFPTGKNTANVGVGVSSVLNKKINIRKLFEVFITGHPMAREKLAGARMLEPGLAGWRLPMGSFSGKRSYRNVLLTGDAASFVDPLFGEGLYYAFRSGELAANALEVSMARRLPPWQAARVYDRLWRRELWWKDLFPAKLMRPFMAKPWALNFTVASANRWPVKARTFVRASVHHTTRLRLLNPF